MAVAVLTQKQREYANEIVRGITDILASDRDTRQYILGYGQALNDAEHKDPSYFRGYLSAMAGIAKGA